MSSIPFLVVFLIFSIVSSFLLCPLSLSSDVSLFSHYVAFCIFIPQLTNVPSLLRFVKVRQVETLVTLLPSKALGTAKCYYRIIFMKCCRKSVSRTGGAALGKTSLFYGGKPLALSRRRACGPDVRREARCSCSQRNYAWVNTANTSLSTVFVTEGRWTTDKYTLWYLWRDSNVCMLPYLRNST
jgi:hypothetical protein